MDTYSAITNPKDKDKINDMLISEKHLTNTYNTFASESSSKNLQQDILTILTDGHELVINLSDEMNKRGWHTVEYANQADIDKVKDSYSKIQ